MINKHFEDIWVQAEKASEVSPTDRSDIFIQLKYALDEYGKLDKIPSNDIQKILRKKKMGEILYKIAELSRTDDINTWEVLQSEIITK